MVEDVKKRKFQNACFVLKYLAQFQSHLRAVVRYEMA